MKRKQGYKRGYPVALLIGFGDHQASLWEVFSHVVKYQLGSELDGSRTDVKALYNFHEAVFNAMRLVLEEGVRSIVVTAPLKTIYAREFLTHMKTHHAYLFKSEKETKVIFAELVGSAITLHEVTELVKTKEFCRIIGETTSKEADHTIASLEKTLLGTKGNDTIAFSLKEIEDIVYSKEKDGDLKNKYLILTDKYLADSKDKNRIHRLLQIAENKKGKTRIVNSETQAGKRISQFGGIVLFTTLTSHNELLTGI